jgi:type IV pilus assembly protein PilW
VENDQAEEIVEGVENMQITYGVDTDAIMDGTANRYLPAASFAPTGASDWARVVSVRISLLLASAEDGMTDSPQSYNFNGGIVTSADRRLYQVMTTTLTLRNRAL